MLPDGSTAIEKEVLNCAAIARPPSPPYPCIPLPATVVIVVKNVGTAVDGCSVGAGVIGGGVGVAVGEDEGVAVGEDEGGGIGAAVGEDEGGGVGEAVGEAEVLEQLVESCEE
jgi:hypothetical protein